MIDGIIFDLDGTLWDSRVQVCDSWNVVLAERWPELGQLTVEQFNSQMGKLVHDIGRSLFPQLSPEQSNAVVDFCCEFENGYVAERGGILYDGLEETLALLSEKYKLFIVSNCQSGYIEAFFEAHGLGKYFADIECSGNTGRPKAENIRLIAERNGLKSPVYVGDTALDGKSAHEAGVPFVWAAYGFGKAESFEARMDSVSQLPCLCEKL